MKEKFFMRKSEELVLGHIDSFSGTFPENLRVVTKKNGKRKYRTRNMSHFENFSERFLTIRNDPVLYLKQYRKTFGIDEAMETE
jgi:hypothetical protein